MSPPQLYRYVKIRDIPTPFWLFVLDKAVYWDQRPCEIKDDEEVCLEWVDVKPIYKELRTRIMMYFDVYNYAVFIADGYRGNVFILLINNGVAEFKVKKGMRIAQLICKNCNYVQWKLSLNYLKVIEE